MGSVESGKVRESRSCPVCNTKSSEAELFLRKSIDPSRISTFSFASRKRPEYMCHQLVKCPTCNLVYANDPPDQDVLNNAYHLADFDSAQEADDAAVAYDLAMGPVLCRLKKRRSALEIGAGTGIFLETLKLRGFDSVQGVEPSLAAIASAPEHRQSWIRASMFNEQDFQPESFDLICCFMTLEHVLEPNDIVSAACRLLRPGGAIALVTHDYTSSINRFFGKYSPIIDIEHMQLFSGQSLRHLLGQNGFHSIETLTFKNRYSLSYWSRLLPLPLVVKGALISGICSIGLGGVRLAFNVGNILSFGFRPL